MNNSQVFIIAEIGQAHDGSLGILHSYIDAAASTGADAVKFQVHIASAESSDHEKFRVPFSYEDRSRYDYWRRMEFTPEQWAGIKQHCEEVELEFIASPFSVAAVELLEQLDVRRYKIASGEIGNFLMLEHIARSGKDIWISSGMSSYEEIGSVLNFLDKREASKKRVLFQCTTAYPTTADRIGLNVLSEFKSRFDLPVGLSDHSGAIYPPLAAIPLGAEYLECHIVFDKAMFGPDSRASLSVAEFRQMVEGVRFIEQAMANPVDKNEVEQYAELKTMFGKSIALSVGLSEGDSLTFEVLESKKPAGQGIPAESYAQVLGKKVKRKIAAGEFLNWEDLD